MSDERQPPADDSHQRKTVSFTHKQLGWGGGIIAALGLVAQLKGTFITREEGMSQTQQLSDIRLQIVTLKTDVTARIDRMADKIVDRIKETEERSVRNVDRLEKRVDNLEIVSHSSVGKKINN